MALLRHFLYLHAIRVEAKWKDGAEKSPFICSMYTSNSVWFRVVMTWTIGALDCSRSYSTRYQSNTNKGRNRVESHRKCDSFGRSNFQAQVHTWATIEIRAPRTSNLIACFVITGELDLEKIQETRTWLDFYEYSQIALHSYISLLAAWKKEKATWVGRENKEEICLISHWVNHQANGKKCMETWMRRSREIINTRDIRGFSLIA